MRKFLKVTTGKAESFSDIDEIIVISINDKGLSYAIRGDRGTWTIDSDAKVDVVTLGKKDLIRLIYEGQEKVRQLSESQKEAEDGK